MLYFGTELPRIIFCFNSYYQLKESSFRMRQKDIYKTAFSEPADEFAHLLFYADPLTADTRVITIDNIERSERICNVHFPQEHIGTELFNATLLELYSVWRYVPTEINGKLSSVDAANGNWKTSIPFYANFPNYLYSDLPYTLMFHLYEDKKRETEIILPENHAFLKSSMSDFCERYKNRDLFFCYAVHNKVFEIFKGK